MAIRVGYQHHAPVLSLPRLACGASVFISAATGRGEAAAMAQFLGSVIAGRVHELYTAPVDDVSEDLGLRCHSLILRIASLFTHTLPTLYHI